jgi:hypothetical protein
MEGAPRVSMLQLLEKSNSANNCTIIDQRRLWSESERGGWLCRGNLKLGDCSDEEVSTTITTTYATVGSHLETNNNEKRGTSAGVTVTVLKSEKRKMYRSYDLEGKSAITIKTTLCQEHVRHHRDRGHKLCRVLSRMHQKWKNTKHKTTMHQQLKKQTNTKLTNTT